MQIFTMILGWVIKTIGWILCWIVLATATYHLLPVKLIPNNQNFLVCVKDNNVPSIMSFDLAKNNKPCEDGYQDGNLSSDYDVKVKALDDNEWEITQFIGDFTDPMIYHYKIVDGKIKPMWYSQPNSLGRLFWAIIFGLIFTLIFYPRLIKCFTLAKTHIFTQNNWQF